MVVFGKMEVEVVEGILKVWKVWRVWSDGMKSECDWYVERKKP